MDLYSASSLMVLTKKLFETGVWNLVVRINIWHRNTVVNATNEDIDKETK
jgi:hypothetical protein